MASRILSIEVGSGITRVVELEHKVKHPKIFNVFTFATPPGVYEDGMVTVNNSFMTQMNMNLEQNKILTKRAVFVVNSNRVANRVIHIPNIKENKIADLLSTNASDYFPVDLSQYELSHEVLGQVDEGGEKKLQVSVIAIPKEIIGGYEKLAETCELSMVGLDYMGNSIKKMMIQEIPEDIKATIKVNEDCSIITIVENGVIQLQRTVNYGIGDAINSVQESNLFGEKLDASDALKVLDRKTCMYRKFEQVTGVAEEDAEKDADIDAEKLKALRQEITDDLRPLVGSITRILDYYQARNAEKKIEKIYLVGLGSACSGLSKLLSNELNYKVVAAQQFTDMEVAKNTADETVHMAEYFACIGAALEPTSVVFAEKKGEKKVGAGDGAAKDSLKVPLIVCGVCVVISIVLVAASTISYMIQKSLNTSLNQKVQELQPAQQIYDEYVATVTTYNDINMMLAMTETPNDVFLDFLSELENNLPSDALIRDLSASEAGITMSVTAGSKESAAKVIVQLRSFATLYDEETSSITQETDESGVITVNFALNTYYTAPVVEQPASETAESTETAEDASTEDVAE